MINFLKRYYVLIAALAATIVFGWYYSKVYSDDYATAVFHFQTDFQEQEQRLEEVLNYQEKKAYGGKIEPL